MYIRTYRKFLPSRMLQVDVDGTATNIDNDMLLWSPFLAEFMRRFAHVVLRSWPEKDSVASSEGESELKDQGIRMLTELCKHAQRNNGDDVAEFCSLWDSVCQVELSSDKAVAAQVNSVKDLSKLHQDSKLVSIVVRLRCVVCVSRPMCECSCPRDFHD